MSQTHQVEDALREADPDGTNKRLKAIKARFEAAVGRIKRLTEEADRLKAATNHMILIFESSERDAIRLLNELDPGKGTEAQEGSAAGMIGQDRAVETAPELFMAFPKPRIAPAMRFSPLGQTMGWLEELMD